MAIMVILAILAHNQYIASVLSYIGQLVPLSAEVVKCFDGFVYKLFPGPANWITPAIARSMKHFGFPCQLVDPQLVSKASMLRYHSNTKLNVDEMGTEMYLHLNAYRKNPNRKEELLEWHEGAFTLNLLRNLSDCRTDGITLEGASSSEGPRWKKGPGLQKIVVQELHSRKYSRSYAIDCLRKRLRRWRLALNLRLSTDIATKNLIVVAKSCKPSVQAAYLRTLCNGWCTARRFRFCLKANHPIKRCLLGCGSGCDSIEHYMQCSTVVKFFHKSGLEHYAPTMSHFLLIQRGLSPLYVCRHARCLYAVYLTHSIFRQNDDSNIDVDKVEQTLSTALKRAGQR